MKNFISKHATVAAFNGAQSTFDKPHVAYIEELAATGGISYQAYVASVTPQHDYVEIGGIKWATMNVGANSVTDYGLYFQWGDTQGYTAAQVGNGSGQKYFSEEDYIYYNNGSYTKYNAEDELITLQTTDDAVTAAWGGNWRMPTISDIFALGDAVDTEWTDDYQGSGIAGLVCTDREDESKTLFFPACGDASYGEVEYAGSNGYYWLSSFDADEDWIAPCFVIGRSGIAFDGGNAREKGSPVRGILDD